MKYLSLFFGLILCCNSASAAIVSADFKQTLNLQDFNGLGERILEANDTALADGFELTSADEIYNPVGWEGALSTDLTSDLLTLTADTTNNYQTIVLEITNIIFSDISEKIVDVQLIANEAVSGFWNPDPALAMSFTDNSIYVSFTTYGLGNRGTFEIHEGLSTTFEIVTSATEVPEPHAFLLMILGLTLLSAARKYRIG